MTIPSKVMTVEEFDKWIFLPQNVNKSFEYIGEEVVEVVSNSYSSMIAGEVLYHIKHFIKMKKKAMSQVLMVVTLLQGSVMFLMWVIFQVKDKQNLVERHIIPIIQT